MMIYYVIVLCSSVYNRQMTERQMALHPRRSTEKKDFFMHHFLDPSFNSFREKSVTLKVKKEILEMML